jgi:hypothetical protein
VSIRECTHHPENKRRAEFAEELGPFVAAIGIV